MTEHELVQAARSGDQGAFETLVKANQAMAYQLAYRMTGNPEDAADLTQEAFLNAWRGLSAFDGRSLNGSWRKRRRGPCFAGGWPPSPQTTGRS